MWQKCPICNGSGVGPLHPSSSSLVPPPCSVCNGSKIIDELTGLPPGNGIQILDQGKLKPYSQEITKKDESIGKSENHRMENDILQTLVRVVDKSLMIGRI